MNEQLLFDKALAHIRKQGKPATDSNGHCVYNTKEGLQCAFAPALIDPASTVNTPAVALLTEYSETIKPEFREVDPDIAADIQDAHDGATPRYSGCGKFMEIFEKNMCSLAKRHSLEYTEPEENNNHE